MLASGKDFRNIYGSKLMRRCFIDRLYGLCNKIGQWVKTVE